MNINTFDKLIKEEINIGKSIIHFHHNFKPKCKYKGLVYAITTNKSDVNCPRCIRILTNEHLFVK